MSRPLFSIHTTDDGSLALYLEEQDAIVDMLEDVVGQTEISDLDELQAVCRESYKAEGHFESLDIARSNFQEMAVKIAYMTRDEALDLASDIIRAFKLYDALKERGTYPELKAVK